MNREELSKKVSDFLLQAKNVHTNRDRRRVYSMIELFKMDLLENKLFENDSNSPKLENEGSDLRKAEIEEHIKNLDEASAKYLALQAGALDGGVLDTIDGVLRISSAVLVLIYSGWIALFFIIIATPIDYICGSSVLGIFHPFYTLSILFRKAVAWGVLLSSGVEYSASYKHDADIFEPLASNSSVSMICYSHTSTLDAFIGAILPPRVIALTKKELFAIPFFAWMLTAFGGIPVDRKNRKSAVKNLQLVSASAKCGDCVYIAPEGTRSLTGQLLPFKKGPFHLWQQLGSVNIIPLVIYGAFELYPRDSFISKRGKVTARFLHPITIQEINDLIATRTVASVGSGDVSAGTTSNDSLYREVVASLLRRRMLEDMRDYVSSSENNFETGMKAKLQCAVTVLVMHTLNAFVFLSFLRYVNSLVLSSEAYQYNKGLNSGVFEYYTSFLMQFWYAVGQLAGVILLISIVFYIYIVYVNTFIMGVWYQLNSNKGKKNE